MAKRLMHSLPQMAFARRMQPVAQFSAAPAKTPIVNSHNEFDPLEEVIVGRLEGATIPEWHVTGKAVRNIKK
jgi:hypothetical protein